MASLTKLDRPLVRRIGDGRLVVRITKEGIELRGFGRRKWRPVSWEQVASLSGDEEDFLIGTEEAEGRRQLRAMGAD